MLVCVGVQSFLSECHNILARKSLLSATASYAPFTCRISHVTHAVSASFLPYHIFPCEMYALPRCGALWCRFTLMQPNPNDAPGSEAQVAPAAVVVAPPHAGGGVPAGGGLRREGSSPMDLLQMAGAAPAEDASPQMSHGTPVSSSQANSIRANNRRCAAGGAARSTIASAVRAASTQGRGCVRGRGTGRGAGRGGMSATATQEAEAIAATSTRDTALEQIKETKEEHHGLRSQLHGGPLIGAAGPSASLSGPARLTRSRGSRDSK